jgi:GxxExxY protein
MSDESTKPSGNATAGVTASADRRLPLEPAMDDVNELTKRIIGCAVEVHRALGPGLQERTYEAAMAIELKAASLSFQRQVAVPVMYKGAWIGEYRIDLIVADAVVVEVKSVERCDPVFEAQVLSYLRASGKHIGLLINFNSHLVTQGIKRLAL